MTWRREFDGQLGVEESLVGGVFQTALHESMGATGAVLVPAVAFGLLHAVGVPTELVGALRAGSWVMLLGVLRYRTEGILAHVAADLTIVAVMLPTLV